MATLDQDDLDAIEALLAPLATQLTGLVTNLSFVLADVTEIKSVQEENTDTLAAIEAKTALIGTGTGGLVRTPVLASGEFAEPLVIGDDYLTAVGRAFVWRITSSVVPATCKLGFYKDSANAIILDGAASAVAGQANQYDLTFQMPAATNMKTPGKYEYSLDIRDASGRKVTLFHSHFYADDGSEARNYVRFISRRTG